MDKKLLERCREVM